MDTAGKPKKYRHGDLIITEIKEFPAGDKVRDEQTEKRILAYGEATGHSHRLVEKENAVEAFKILNDVYINLLKPTTIDHEDHGKKTLPKGKYRVRIARERDPFSDVVRTVID